MQQVSRIPVPFREPLQDLAELGDTGAQRLIDAVASADAFQPVQRLQETVRSSLSEAPKPEASWLVSVLLSLSTQFRPTPPGEVATAVSESPALELEADARDRLRERLSALLMAEAIRSTSSAVDLLTQHDRNYHTARILTDIRPVFPEEVSQQPTGAVIVEVLQLQVWDRDGEAETLHIAMDEPDLEELKQVVDRALAKTQTLREFLERQGVTYFELDKRTT